MRKQPTGRKPGGQPGHDAHLRERLPGERLTEPTVHYRPEHCDACQHSLPLEATAADPAARWHQGVELPEMPVQVTEYQAHGRTCPHCGHLTWAKLPDDVHAHVCGPRLTAMMAFLSGALHVSKRGIKEFVETVCGVPIALGTVSNLEAEMSEALAGAHAEAQKAVQQAEVKNVDETGWKQAGGKCWLWGAATALVACFVIAPTRGACGLAALLGRKIKGITQRPLVGVWPIAAGPAAIVLGPFETGLPETGRSGRRRPGSTGSSAWRPSALCLRSGNCSVAAAAGRRLQRELAAFRPMMREWLEAGAAPAGHQGSGACGNLLAAEPALWTFVYKRGVEPTNNHIERLLRSGVLVAEECLWLP